VLNTIDQRMREPPRAANEPAEDACVAAATSGETYAEDCAIAAGQTKFSVVTGILTSAGDAYFTTNTRGTASLVRLSVRMGRTSAFGWGIYCPLRRIG
jgi:hypothetical protein